MLYKDSEKIRKSMNEYGRQNRPFLFVLNFEMTEGYFIENPLQQTDIYFQINGIGNKLPLIEKPENIEFRTYPISPNQYKRKFDMVRKGLLDGNSFLTNLTVRTPIQTNLCLADIFSLSNSPFQIYIPNQFVCFSPERFVKIQEEKIYTYPMKGTIDANIENAEQLILSNKKEIAEHSTIVDLLRNDLSIVAKNVYVNRFRYIDKINTKDKSILQVSSEISGELTGNYLEKLGDIIFQMLPAGSISGAPKKSTVNIIAEAEQEERGYYTGIFGYFDGKNLDSAVMIRFIEENNSNYYFRSGGGITAYSNWESEYKEVLDKIYLPFL